MAIKRPTGPTGELVTLTHESKVLRDNPLGDPHVRALQVWLPPQYSRGRGRRQFPVLFDLVGYTGSGPAHTHWRAFDENVPERLERLLHARRIPPAIVVFPDCFTALGGNQYINSTAIGAYADYLVDELVPCVDAEFRTLASREHRGCFGKSSGGYGALVHGMQHADTWGAVACHSGDAYFDFVYRSDWPAALDTLARYRQPAYRAGAWKPLPAHRAGAVAEGMDDGRIRRFLEAVWQRERPSGADITCLMLLCMAASYDPDPAAPNGFRVPLDMETGAWIERRWKHWLRHDPIHMVGRHRKALKSLRGLFIDCGWRDQYHIHHGARQLSLALQAQGIEHRYEEFDGTHSGIDHRMDVSLPWLLRTLK